MQETTFSSTTCELELGEGTDDKMDIVEIDIEGGPNESDFDEE